MTILNTADAVCVGSTEEDAVYAGPIEVWPPQFPATLPGLAVWFDASQLYLDDGAPVAPWPNLANYRAPGTIIASPPPTVRADALNGLPVVHFLPNQGSLVMDNTGVDLDYTCVFLARMVNGADRIITADIAHQNFLLGWVSGNQDSGYSYGYFDSYVMPWTTDWKLYSSDCDSVERLPTLYSNGVLIGKSLNDPGTIPGCWGGSLVISGLGWDDGTQTSDCEVAEFILYDRKLSDVDRQAVEGYLRQKWLSSPPSLPQTVPGLLYWTDASQLALPDGASVLALPDLSGNGHNGTSEFGGSPTLHANAAGSLSALLWTPGSGSPTDALKLPGLATAMAGRSAFSVLVAVQPVTFGDYPIVLTAPDTDAWDWVFEFDANNGGVFCGVGNGAYKCFTAGTPANEWSLLTWTHDSTGDRFWLGASEITVFYTGPSGPAYPVVPAMTGDAILGGYYNDQFGMQGDIGEMLIYDHALTDTERQKLAAYMGRWLPSLLDPDTQAYLDATGLDASFAPALDSLVRDLKSHDLWSKMSAVYPMIGGTAALHRWNLMDPRDADAAYRLTFVDGGSSSHSDALGYRANEEGQVLDGGYADTHCVPLDTLDQDSTHLAFYSLAEVPPIDRTEMGCFTWPPAGSEARFHVIAFYAGSFFYYGMNEAGASSTSVPSSTGLFVATRTASNLQAAYRNGEPLATSSNLSIPQSPQTIWLGGINFYRACSDLPCGFASIGSGFTDQNVADLYAVVQAYQTALARQV